ncbi:MAG: polysaccharide deacetylase family protein [Clostridium sp.]|uniref:polysaccharide deacetylase family protein n=1 Tax=Clostridium sp. TaxID=1506 RepID=UPI0026716AE1|nr:polysaccharide deacetylase family protein [Clostridium sp.]MDD7683707.1 polysaccharide deacetylase family protein [Clostridium sp.]MDY2581371.1 polysaccharide deacetylase family protein [Clostridium sp.]
MEELRLKHIRRRRKRRKRRFIIILIIVNALLGWIIWWKIGRALMIKESSEKTDTAFQNIVENNELNIDENEVSDEFSNYNVEENYEISDNEISDYEEDNIDEGITYYVEDENAQDIQNRLQSWNFQREDNKKIAYLTFDDGRSENVTPQILDILDKNDVKATFFVLGTAIEGGEKQKELLRRMDEEGHAIGNHGYSHNYKILYPNGVVDASAFISDIKRTEEIINDTLGYELH